jgi:hypothetical protein
MTSPSMGRTTDLSPGSRICMTTVEELDWVLQRVVVFRVPGSREEQG